MLAEGIISFDVYPPFAAYDREEILVSDFFAGEACVKSKRPEELGVVEIAFASMPKPWTIDSLYAEAL